MWREFRKGGNYGAGPPGKILVRRVALRFLMSGLSAMQQGPMRRGARQGWYWVGLEADWNEVARSQVSCKDWTEMVAFTPGHWPVSNSRTFVPQLGYPGSWEQSLPGLGF